MSMLNPELAQIARDIVGEMREEKWGEDDIKWSTSGAILKYIEEHELIEEPTSKENMAAIQVLVAQVQREGALETCIHCGNMHQVGTMDECPLRPKV